MSLLYFLNPFWGHLSSLVRFAQHSVVLTAKPSKSHFLVSFLVKGQKENKICWDCAAKLSKWSICVQMTATQLKKEY